MVEPKKGSKWPTELPKFSSRPDAIAVCKELCSRQYMHRSEKVGKGELEVRRFFAIMGEGDMYLFGGDCVELREVLLKEWQHFLESPMRPSRVPIGATCCQNQPSRDSSCLEVIGLWGFGSFG